MSTPQPLPGIICCLHSDPRGLVAPGLALELYTAGLLPSALLEGGSTARSVAAREHPGKLLDMTAGIGRHGYHAPVPTAVALLVALKDRGRLRRVYTDCVDATLHLPATTLNLPPSIP